MKPALGHLETVELRDYWKREDNDFTPWLASDENLARLGTALGIELAKEDTEVGVGPYRADILATNTETKDYVLIENQLERTDHSHLGQLLTYAAGLNATTIVWVAKRFTDEHRAALDWLNRMTNEGLSFFGVEIELLRIGNSVPAPRFNVVAKSNDWVKTVAGIAQHGKPTPAQTRNFEFWTGLNDRLEEKRSPLALRKPSRENWLTWGVGTSDFHIWARLAEPMYVGLTVKGPKAAEKYAWLRENAETIQRELGDILLIWQETPKKEWDLKIPLPSACNPDDRASWPALHEWMQSNLERLDKVFRVWVKRVPADLSSQTTLEDEPAA